jgi:hypothetical protein
MLETLVLRCYRNPIICLENWFRGKGLTGAVSAKGASEAGRGLIGYDIIG